MSLLKLFISFTCILPGGFAFCQTGSISDSGYFEINYNKYNFYLINAESSETERFFELAKNEKLYLLAFDWKYGFYDAEIVYSKEDTVRQILKYSARCVTCPMYLPVKLNNEFPEKIILNNKLRTKQFTVELNHFKIKALKLEPLINENDYIKWESLPSKLWK